MTGTPRGGTLFATNALLLVVAGGVVAVRLPVRDVPARGLPLLVGWLLFAGAAVWCAELAVARAGRTGTSDAKLRLATTGALATALAAELILITARLARDHDYGTAWASGGILLALFLGAIWRTAAISGKYSGYIPAETSACATFALAEVCVGWLTVRFAMEGPLWAAWCLGCAMVALAAAFWFLDSQFSSAWDTYDKVFGCIAVLGVAGVVAQFAVRDETASAWWVGGVGTLVLLYIGAMVFGDSMSFTFSWPWAEKGYSSTASLGVQFAGILVPLASLAWAAWGGNPSGRSSSGWGPGDDRLLGLSYLAGAGAILLAAQSAVLAWTGTAPPQRWLAALIGGVRRLAHADPERSMLPGSDSQHHAYDPHYEREWQREQQEWEEDWNRHIEHLRELMPNERKFLSALHKLAHPLPSAAVIAIYRDTALATGLAIDEMWPRIELVAPDQVKTEMRRRERGVLAWRIVVASAVCTAAVWLFIALAGLGGFRLESGSPALLVVGPLLVAAVAVTQARRLLVEVCAAKADAIDVLRYDMARRLHLELPETPSGMIRLASTLSGDRDSFQYPGRRPEEPSPSEYPGRRPPHSFAEDTGPLPGSRLDQLAVDVADQVRSGLRADVRQAIRGEHASLAEEEPARAMFTEADLAQLAQEISDSAAEPVSRQLKDHLTYLQQNFHEDVRAAIRSTLEESVTGPPLTNFVGYFAIELDRRMQSEERPPVRVDGGTIKAPVGRRVNLVVSVVRDQRAANLPPVVASHPGKDFFVFEPVRVEGGRDARTVSFDVMADSSTLTPLPQRQNLLVEDEKQTTFRFQTSEEEGSHEVWFQLYQAGHLVQVVALKIKAEAAPNATDSDEAEDGV
ncbi:hypothetical protein [Streptomyces diastatochromogenes]|nr:hypothetical protein [Streptomyces diastatochromogenes]MCZ0991813.1 hypothetical protein [Streptomyces diastatochromogenes]